MLDNYFRFAQGLQNELASALFQRRAKSSGPE